ncbi:MAG: hypothetical protein U0805_08650 [Pirellulales bacterium]
MKWKARVVGHMKVDPNEFVVLDHLQVQGTDYSQRELRKFTSIGSKLERCRFDNARIEDASFGSGLEMSEYIECSFDGVRIQHGGGFARFVRCSFRNIDFRSWLCFGAEFIDCVFTGRLKGCIFNGTLLEQDQPYLGRVRNEFHGNDFSGADLDDVAFRTGIDLTQQRLPCGPEYLYVSDAPRAVAEARSAAQLLADQNLRMEVLKLLDSFNLGLEGGQRQFLLRKSNYSVYSRDVIDLVFDFLCGG